MRVIPGMTILNPCDAVDADAAVKAAIEYVGPCYLRIGRNPVEVVMDQVPDYHFEIGKGITLRDGNDIAILTTGILVQEALKAYEMLRAEGIYARVINIHTIKPLDREIIEKAAHECGAIVTSEEHNLMAGFGSAVAEVVAEACPVPLICHGVNDMFGRSGTARQVLDAYGVNAQGIVESVHRALAIKQV